MLCPYCVVKQTVVRRTVYRRHKTYASAGVIRQGAFPYPSPFRQVCQQARIKPVEDARRLARELSQSGVLVVSGLALGVDTEALKAALEASGRTIAVIGTPIDKAYPAENKRLQELIYRENLLISQFPPGKKTYPSNFPERNKLMATISDATVIVEASDTSGSLHQAAECLKLNRWLFIAKSVLEDRTLQWPSKFTHYAKTRPLNVTDDILNALNIREPSGMRVS